MKHLFKTLIFVFLFFQGVSFASGYGSIFVTVDDLKKKIGLKNLVIIDAREGRAYEKGHIKGAYPVRWREISNMTPKFPERGWATVTDKEKLSKVISQRGITLKSEIVIYGDTIDGWGEEGRIYWSFKIAGLSNMKILDGGIKAWIDSGEKAVRGSFDKSRIQKSDYKINHLNLEEYVDTKELVKNFTGYRIIDTRTEKEFKGAKKFGEKRGGHLPSAILIPYKSLLKNGFLKPEDEILKTLKKNGITRDDQIVAYCTAGVRSAYVQVVLKMLGFKVKNYDESFVVWAGEKNTRLGAVDDDFTYNYITEAQLKNDILQNRKYIILYSGENRSFNKSIAGRSIESYKIPSDITKERSVLSKTVPVIKKSDKDIIIANPKDKKNSIRLFKYLTKAGIDSRRLYIIGKDKRSFWFF